MSLDLSVADVELALQYAEAAAILGVTELPAVDL
jgi:hypothetical protein